MVQSLRKKWKEQKGFTLIELLAVIVILGIIAAIAIPSITKIIQNSRVDAVRADAIEVYNAGKLYASQYEQKASFNGDDLKSEVLDHTSLTGIGFTVQDNGTLLLTASGSAGSVTVTITGASFEQINYKDNWKVSGNSIEVNSKSPTGPTPASP